jgi:hypothetical protein
MKSSSLGGIAWRCVSNDEAHRTGNVPGRCNRIELFRVDHPGLFDSGVTAGQFLISWESLMSLAEYLSKPPPVFGKMADILGNFRAVQFLFRVAALLRGNKARAEPLASEFSAETSGVAGAACHQETALLIPSRSDAAAEPASEAGGLARIMLDYDTDVLKTAGNHAIAEPGTPEERVTAIAGPEPRDQPAREKLIRRRWAETGIRLWNPDLHGAGNAALNIQGGVALLPPKPGGKLPRYDTLEFKTVRCRVDGQEVSQILCEGVVVNPPQRRTRGEVRRLY